MTARFAITATTALIVLFGGVNPASAAAGDLDESFGGDGRVVTGLFNSGFLSSEDVAASDGGELVSAGAAVSGDGREFFALSRHALNGGFDESFGGDGIVTTPFGDRSCVGASALALMPAGKILAVGSAGCRRGGFGLVRYDADGGLDETFGNDGKEITRVDCYAYARAVAVQADGKILAVGTTGCRRGPVRFAVVRYRGDGRLDHTFGGDGKVRTDLSGGWDEAHDVALDGQGRIVVAGTVRGGTGRSRFALARYKPNGVRDDTFGGDGVVTVSFGKDECGPVEAHALALQSDGKIVVSGTALCGLPYLPLFGIARLRPSGRLDGFFGNNGRVITSFGNQDCADSAEDLAVQNDGRIVAVGVAGCRSPRVALARYRSDGDLDANFGGDGRVRTPVRNAECYETARSVALQSDGQIVVAGMSLCEENTKAVLARYES